MSANRHVSCVMDDIFREGERKNLSEKEKKMRRTKYERFFHTMNDRREPGSIHFSWETKCEQN